MRAEYDFDYSKGVRGKYYKRHMEGTNTIVNEPGSAKVVLEPDVAKVFKTSRDVNKALRSLLKLAARMQRFAKAKKAG